MALPSVLPFQPQFNYPNNKLYQYEAYPILLSCNFVVDSTNGNGLGIRNLKGTGIANVFMHTSATPGPGNYGVVNPNPQSGMILVQFQNQFNRYLSGFSGLVSPLTGSALTSVTSGLAYVITSLGTTTTAQWVAAGLPAGMVPNVGAAFIAKETGAIGGTGTVEVPGVSGITSIEVVGDPNQTLQNSNLYQNGGAQMVLQTLASTSSSVTTLIPTAPANNSVIGLNFYLSNSSVSVNGQ
jgi:hypothetical protein